MLMRFSINNFMSFPYKEDKDGRIQAEEFSLYAGRTEQFKERISRFQDRKVLKFGAVYGANAAGKSNLMKAIDAGRKIIISGAENLDLKDKYCRNIEINKEKQTLFEYEFSTNEKCFAYGFTINLWKQKILTEWLVELENQKERTIYERDAETEEYYFDEEFFHEEESKRQFLFYIEDSNRIESTLLLRELARRKLNKNDFELFYNVFHWFDRSLVIIYPNTRLGEGYFRFDNDNVELVKLLDYLDTGITGYKLQDLNENAFREYFTDSMLADELLKSNISGVRTVLKYNKTLFELFFHEKGVEKISKLLFRHGKDENYYEYGEESDGTQRLIELLEVILNDDGEKTFIIDELDRSMHPQMTKKFVETFFDFSKNKHTQLIITTHESYLMDLNLLRRDEIWFAEREKNCTMLYSLEKFKIRYDKVVSKDYLIGRYGAVPVFKDFDYVWGREED